MIENGGHCTEPMDLLVFDEELEKVVTRTRLIDLAIHRLLQNDSFPVKYITKSRSSFHSVTSKESIIGYAAFNLTLNYGADVRSAIFFTMNPDFTVPEYKLARKMLIDEVNKICENTSISKIPHKGYT